MSSEQFGAVRIEVSGSGEDVVMTARSEEFVRQSERLRRELLAHCYRTVGLGG
jgi:hypothetical protein